MNHDDGSDAHSVACVETWKIVIISEWNDFPCGGQGDEPGRIQKREAEGCWYYGTGKP